MPDASRPVRLERQHRLVAAAEGRAGEVAERRRAVDEDEVPRGRQALEGSDRAEREIDLETPLGRDEPRRRRARLSTPGARDGYGQVGEAAAVPRNASNSSRAVCRAGSEPRSRPIPADRGR